MEMDIDHIRLKDEFQVRVSMDSDLVESYAASLKDLPPIIVWRNPDGGFDLLDGWHRLTAHRKSGAKTVTVTVFEGDHTAAVLKSISANQNHGLRLNSADRMKIARIIISHPEMKNWSSTRLAELIGGSHHTVDRYLSAAREELEIPEPETVTGKDGKTYPKQKPKPQQESEVSDEPIIEADSPAQDHSSPKVGPPKRLRDKLGIEIESPQTAEIFAASEGKEALSALQEIQRLLGSLATSPVGTKIRAILVTKKDDQDPDAVVYYSSAIEDLKRDISRNLPHVGTCPTCGNSKRNNCKVCLGLGWLTKTQYDRLTPEQQAKLTRMASESNG